MLSPLETLQTLSFELCFAGHKLSGKNSDVCDFAKNFFGNTKKFADRLHLDTRIEARHRRNRR